MRTEIFEDAQGQWVSYIFGDNQTYAPELHVMCSQRSPTVRITTVAWYERWDGEDEHMESETIEREFASSKEAASYLLHEVLRWGEFFRILNF